MKLSPKLRFTSYFVILALTAVTTSCNKEDPELPLADQIAGEYTGTYYTVGGTTKVTLPATNAAGVTATSKISVIKISEDKATFKVTFTLTDKAGKATDSFNNFDGLTLKKAATGEIEGYQGTNKITSLNNGELSVTATATDPTKTVIFYGKKN